MTDIAKPGPVVISPNMKKEKIWVDKNGIGVSGPKKVR